MNRTIRHPEVIEALGNPVKDDNWLPAGNFSINDASGVVEFSTSLKGPNGKGKLYVKATKTAGEWSFDYAQVEIPGREGRIDLLEEEEKE